MNSCPVIPLSKYDKTPRIIAIGDIHGDWDILIKCLLLANVIHLNKYNKYDWIGSNTVVIQVGDILDSRCRAQICHKETPGNNEELIYKFLINLNKEAEKVGGNVLIVLGNHELMNIMGDLSYASDHAVNAFGGYDNRKKIFQPGIGYWANLLACNANSIIQVGSWLFAHAGLTIDHVVDDIDAINVPVRNYILGKQSSLNPTIMDFFWHRNYERGYSCDDFIKYISQLRGLSAPKGMVIGHSVQSDGITNICDGKIWKIDIGMSRAFGNNNRVQVLEILNDGASINILESN